MTLIPLLGSDAGSPDYLLLEEALGQGVVDETTVSQGGSVPDLNRINKSARKLSVVDGEELVGAKVDRIVNTPLLIAGHTNIAIHASSAEQGRSSYRSQRFASGEKVMPRSMHRGHQMAVAISLNKENGDRSNRSMIGNRLAMKSERMAFYLPIKVMVEPFEGKNESLAEYPMALRLEDRRVGAFFALK